MKITRSQLKQLIKEELSDDTGDDTMLGGDNLVSFPKPDYLSSDMPGQDRMELTRQAVSDSRGDDNVAAMENEVEDLVAQLLANREAGVANLADYDDDYDDYEDDDYEEYDEEYDKEDDSIVFDFSKF
jgi:hypothetical protein